MNKAKPYIVVTVSALTLALSTGAAQAAQLDSGEAKANVLAPISADQLGNLLSSDLSAALALPDHNHDHDNVKFDGSTESDGHLGGTFDV